MSLNFGGNDRSASSSELERLRNVTELMGVAVTRCSRELRYEWVSTEYAKWIGLSPEQIAGRLIVDVIGPEAFATLEPYFVRVLGGEPVEYESMIALATIGDRWVRGTYMPTRDAAGVVDGWVATIEDVTERKQLETAGARLAAIVEGSDDAIIGKTLDGIITTWNPGAERLFGYTAEEMIGQPIQRIMPPERVDDMSRILSSIRRGERVDHYETERIRKDGRRIHVSLSVSPIKDVTGRVIGASKIARDVTERRRTEEALAETLDVLATLNQTSTLLSAELDMQKLVQAVTDAATEVTGARFGAFFYNDVDERGESYTLYSLSGAAREAFAEFPVPRNTEVFGPTFRGEGVVRSDDIKTDPRYGKNPPFRGMPPGHLSVTSYLAVPVLSRGRVLGGLFFGHPDPGVFTERHERVVVGLAAQASVAMENARLYAAERSARDEAELANRTKDEFLSMVSHELRTPLASMLSWVNVLRRGKPSPEHLERALDVIERSGKIQAELINDLLDVSRVMTGRLKMALVEVELAGVIEAALEGVRPELEASRIHLETFLEPGIVVRGDSIRLQQIVSNVVTNAVKFTAMGGRVEVRIERTPCSAKIVVRDDGKGIAEDFLPYVFDPFRQSDDVKKRKSGGLGLGLAIVRTLVEQHGGDVRAESAGEGAGATFTIVLPLATDVGTTGAPKEEQ